MIKHLQFQGLQLDVVDMQTKRLNHNSSSVFEATNLPQHHPLQDSSPVFCLRWIFGPPAFAKLTFAWHYSALLCLVLPCSDTAALHLPPLSHPVGIFALFLKHFHAPSALPQSPLNREQQTVKTGNVSRACLCVHFIRYLWHEATKEQLPQKKIKKEMHLNHIYFMHIYAHFRWFILLQEQTDIFCYGKCHPEQCTSYMSLILFEQQRGSTHVFICHITYNLAKVALRVFEPDQPLGSLLKKILLRVSNVTFTKFLHCFWMIRCEGKPWPLTSSHFFIQPIRTSIKKFPKERNFLRSNKNKNIVGDANADA